MKKASSNREFMINPELKKVIQEFISKYPELDSDKIVEKIIESNTISRMNNAAIKSGTVAFFRTKKIGVTPKPQDGQNDREIADVDFDKKPSKKIKKNQFLIEFQDNESYKFKNLGGISEVCQRIESELFSLILKDQYYKKISRLSPNRGFLISGSPGSGKTILANCILSYFANLQSKKISTYSVNSFQFLGGDAQDKLKKLFQAAQQSVPSVIFIDNIEELCNKDNNKRMQSLPSLSLCNYINRVRDKEIYLLAVTSAPEKLDILTRPGMFYKQIKINNPDEVQRKQILEKLLLFYNHNVTQHMKELILMTAGYVAVDMAYLLKQASVRCVERIGILKTNNGQNQQFKPQVIITIEDFRNANKEVQPILKKDGFAKIPNVKLEDVGALDNIKEELAQEIIMPLREQEKFKSMNFQVSGGGILLYGPPGCGKTMIAKAIANEANANFITVKGPELLTKYVGESEEAVRKVFQRARLSAPCIIFFDQFDALAPKRQDQGNQVTQRVVNTLLNQLNGIDDRKMVFVIAATNRPDIIDEAVLRSGRIEKHLYVPLPNNKERLQILSKITRKVNREENLDLQDIAMRTDNFSGADLYFLVKKSIVTAISNDRAKIDAKDLKNALQNYKKDKYNKNNRLKLSQFEQQQQQQSEKQYIFNNEQERQRQIKKSRSMMEVEKNQVSKKKQKVNHKVKQNLLNSFIEHLLQNNKSLKNSLNK